MDHVLFKNADVTTVHPCMRDASGWIVREADSYIVVCSDVPSPGYEYMSFDMIGSGLVILKDDIKEIRQVA